jgi:hypothetical protein
MGLDALRADVRMFHLCTTIARYLRICNQYGAEVTSVRSLMIAFAVRIRAACHLKWAKKLWDSEIAKTIDDAARWQRAPQFTLTICNAFRG